MSHSRRGSCLFRYGWTIAKQRESWFRYLGAVACHIFVILGRPIECRTMSQDDRRSSESEIDVEGRAGPPSLLDSEIVPPGRRVHGLTHHLDHTLCRRKIVVCGGRHCFFSLPAARYRSHLFPFLPDRQSDAGGRLALSTQNALDNPKEGHIVGFRGWLGNGANRNSKP